ncbi:hypothetical protein [Spiroplasma sp. BIUS-1]|uniref:hypothetical protein n=1 Tax=Spiroplasma sp. BIUS-1 TaxID=216964 RepID=UPI001397BABD|nr:hypothetical protein [Spiroplasma sp. BIUS-1]QHX36714.1 hypothetical protein SBIUS_v1c04610 [Spiroplasma sp. BIUS-1]
MKNKKQNKNDSIDLLKKQNKIINKFFKTNRFGLATFIFDQVVFATAFILFILNLVLKISSPEVSYSILALSAYLLFKFTYINWFAKNKFFQCITIFDYSVKLSNQKFRAKRSIEFTPIWFWVYIIGSNFITVIFINYELSSFLSEKPVMSAIGDAMLNAMLLPSFLNSFQKLAKSDKQVESNYTNLVKDQYFSNESLFKDAKLSDNNLNAVFSKNDLVSKNGLFIFTNKKDLTEKETTEIKKINEKILATYTEIWANYYDLLETSASIEFSKSKAKKLFWLERIYDHIFLDFFNI